MSSGANLTVPNLFDFSNHVALVTGGATGLGEMAAQGFVQNGAKVIIASRKKAELQKTADRLNKLGPGRCEIVVADLKDKAGCDSLVADVKKMTDRVTVLLNNSGATWYVPSPALAYVLSPLADMDSQGSTIQRLPRKRLGQTHGPQRQSHVLHNRRPGTTPVQRRHGRPSVTRHQHRLHGRHPNHRRDCRRRRRPGRARLRHLQLRALEGGVHPPLEDAGL